MAQGLGLDAKNSYWQKQCVDFQCIMKKHREKGLSDCANLICSPERAHSPHKP